MAFLSKVGNVLRQTVSKQIALESSVSRPSIYQALRCMSSSKVFVGGISYATDDVSLREAFSKYGEVVEARVILDRETGRSRGFGFITYSTSEEASSAIQALDGQDLHGRRIRVNYANDRARGGGFGGGGYGGGGYGIGSGGYGGGGGGYGGGDGGYGGGGAVGGYNSNYGGAGYGGGGNTFDRGTTGAYGNEPGSGVAGGGGGSDSFSGGGNNASFDSGFGGGDKFDAGENDTRFDSNYTVGEAAADSDSFEDVPENYDQDATSGHK